jgi:hypothetical protein
MSNYNTNSGFGRIISSRLATGGAGKIFVVGKAALAYIDIYRELFSSDADGTILNAATVDAAIGLCTAGAGDTIYVLPGHTEVVTSTSIAHDVSSVSVIGLGVGAIRPTFTFSTAAATITVTAPNGMWKNCRFIANFADVAAAFTLGATSTDFRVGGCDFTETGTDLNWFNILVTGSTNNASDGLTMIGNYSLMIDAAAKAFVSILGNCDRVLITDNIHITGATSDAAQFMTCSSKVLLGARVLRNWLQITGANSGATVGLFQTGSSTTSTGVFGFNLVNSIDTTTALFNTTGQGFALQENYVSGAVDKQGTLYPAADNPA